MLRAVAGGSGSGSSGLTIGTTTITGGTTGRLLYDATGTVGEAAGLTTDGTDLTIASASRLLWSTDLILIRKAAASLQLGAADAAAPIAQTFGTQSVVAGTSNTNGANFTIRGSAGTGTGTGGSLLFQVATAGSTGSTQNSQVTTLTLAQDLSATFAGAITSAGNILAGAGSFLSWNGRVLMSAPNTTDILLRDSSFASFGKIQLGGTGTGHPAINRNGTGIDIKLADGSAFTNIKGKLTTDNAYVGTPAVSTGTVIIYDSAGTALRVLVANP